jgi:hypothetical protein
MVENCVYYDQLLADCLCFVRLSVLRTCQARDRREKGDGYPKVMEVGQLTLQLLLISELVEPLFI